MSGFPTDMFYMGNDDRFIIIMCHLKSTDGTFGYFYSQHEEEKAFEHYKMLRERKAKEGSKDSILYLSGCQVKENPAKIDTSIVSEYTKDKIASMSAEELEATIELCIQEKRNKLIASWKKKDEEYEKRFAPTSLFEEPGRRQNAVANTLQDFEGDTLSVAKLSVEPAMELSGVFGEYIEDSETEKLIKLIEESERVPKPDEDSLVLVWFSHVAGRQFEIGKLTKGRNFTFEYLPPVRDALSYGFLPIPPFGKMNTKYESDSLFPVFSSRLPSKNRPDILKILNKYDMVEYDEFELLKRSGAKLPIDNLRFEITMW